MHGRFLSIRRIQVQITSLKEMSTSKIVSFNNMALVLFERSVGGLASAHANQMPISMVVYNKRHKFNNNLYMKQE
jgi:hypothetical protein